MATTSFSFYELPVTVGGIEWLLTGEDIGLHFGVQSADPEVGIMEAYAEDICIDDDSIELVGFYRLPSGEWTDEEYKLVLESDMFAFVQVETAAYRTMEDAANAESERDRDYGDYNY
jgi:hypothetical protein